MKKAEAKATKTATKVATIPTKKAAATPAAKKAAAAKNSKIGAIVDAIESNVKALPSEAKANAAEIKAAEDGTGKAKAAALKATASKPETLKPYSALPIDVKSQMPAPVVELKPARLAVLDIDAKGRKRANALQDALKAAGIDASMGREKGGSQVWVDADKYDAAIAVRVKLEDGDKKDADLREQQRKAKLERRALKAAAKAEARATKRAEREAKKATRRITPGTPLKQWRVVKSQRVGMPGFFLQGGETKAGPKGPRSFFVGVEMLFKTAEEARKALAEKPSKPQAKPEPAAKAQPPAPVAEAPKSADASKKATPAKAAKTGAKK